MWFSKKELNELNRVCIKLKWSKRVRLKKIKNRNAVRWKNKVSYDNLALKTKRYFLSSGGVKPNLKLS